jgi:hypothetical protein
LTGVCAGTEAAAVAVGAAVAEAAGGALGLLPALLHAASSNVAASATGSFQIRVVMISPISDAAGGSRPML